MTFAYYRAPFNSGIGSFLIQSLRVWIGIWNDFKVSSTMESCLYQDLDNWIVLGSIFLTALSNSDSGMLSDVISDHLTLLSYFVIPSKVISIGHSLIRRIHRLAVLPLSVPTVYLPDRVEWTR